MFVHYVFDLLCHVVCEYCDVMSSNYYILNLIRHVILHMNIVMSCKFHQHVFFLFDFSCNVTKFTLSCHDLYLPCHTACTSCHVGHHLSVASVYAMSCCKYTSSCHVASTYGQVMLFSYRCICFMSCCKYILPCHLPSTSNPAI